jgi:carbon starvation protein
VIVMLALAIIVVRPEITVPAFSEFASRENGPVFPGALFPFLFVTIACGALSGFHALISSGTTPKLIEKERQARFIGYGGMLMESFVAIMALVAAISIDRGLYFAMNSPVALTGGTVETAATWVNSLGLAGVNISPDLLAETAWPRRPGMSVRKALSPAPVALPPLQSAWPTSCSSSSAARQ